MLKRGRVVQNAAECPHVDLVVVRLLPDKLGTRIQRRPYLALIQLLLGAHESAGDAKVPDLQVSDEDLP